MQLNNTKYPTLDSLLSSRAKELSDHRFLLHPLYNTAETATERITYGLFDTHLSCLAHAWASMERHNAPLIAPKMVVGVFLPSGYTLCVAMFALIRLGAVPFCLSPRNSDEGLKHLLRTEKITTIVTTSIDGVLPRLETILAADTSFDISLLDVSEISRNDSDTVVSYPSLPEGIIKPVDTVIMQHTSGSTAFPKAVRLSNALLLRSVQGGSWWVNGFHNTSDIAVGQPPIFHMFGLMGGLLNSMYRGHTFAIPPLPKTDNQGLFPSPATLRDYARQVGATEFFGVSSTVVGVARCEGGIELFKSLRRVVVGGAPMPRENGDWIVSHGVHLVEVVGSTEAGSLMNSNRTVGDPNWQGMKVCSNLPHHFEPFGEPPQTLFELVLHSSAETGEFAAADPTTKYFHTHDLFQEWPEPGCGTYRHCGRSDDVLLLSSGQNWNPRPMELQIEASPVVQHAVIFGHARPNLGALIAPRGPGGPGTLPEVVDWEMRKDIWAAIEVANAIAPLNARIPRSFVLLVTGQGVVPLDPPTHLKHIPLADKGTPLRGKTYNLFQDEISALYTGIV